MDSPGSSVEQPRLTDSSMARFSTRLLDAQYGHAQALADQRGGFAAGVGEQHHKFFTTVAEHHIDVAQAVLQCAGDGFECLVADQVAVAIVDPLEVVDVDHQYRQRLQSAAGDVHFALECLLHGDAVAGLGQRVAQCALQGCAVEQGIAQRKQQAGEQGFELAELVLAEALVAAERQLTKELTVDGSGGSRPSGWRARPVPGARRRRPVGS